MVSPYSGAPGAQHGQPPMMVPGGGPAPGPPGYGGPGRQGNGLLAAIVMSALVVTVAAVVVGVIAVTRPAPNTAPAASAPVTSQPTAAPTKGTTTEADRALCTAIAPLMAETIRISKAWTSLSGTDPAEFDPATARYISDIRAWLTRIQPVIDEHPEADPLFHRTLQRLIDDHRLIVAGLAADPTFDSYSRYIWDDHLAAYNGPFHTCDDLGITW